MPPPLNIRIVIYNLISQINFITYSKSFQQWIKISRRQSLLTKFKESRGGPVSVRNVLPGSGASGITFWGRDLGFVDRDVPEGGGGAHGLIKKSDGAEGQEAEGQDLEKRNISQDNQRSSNPDTGDVN